MHGPDIPPIEVQHSMARIREAASKTQEAPSKILNKKMAKDLPADFRGYWPKEPTMKRSIQRVQYKILDSAQVLQFCENRVYPKSK